MKTQLRRFLPGWALDSYNRLVSRHIIRKRMGAWFDVDWKLRAPQADDREWVRVYNVSWEHWERPDLTPTDLTEIIGLLDDYSSMLDVGCGDGFLLEILRKHCDRLGGVDIAAKALTSARQRLGVEALLAQAFAENLPFADDSFDAVVSTHTIEHVRDPRAAVAEMLRVAARRMIVLTPCQDYRRYTEDYHLHFFPDEEALRAAVGLPEAFCKRYRSQSKEAKFSGEVMILTVKKQ